VQFLSYTVKSKLSQMLSYKFNCLGHTGQLSGAYDELHKFETEDGAMWQKHVVGFIRKNGLSGDQSIDLRSFSKTSFCMRVPSVN
jgi:hypothetical protein